MSYSGWSNYETWAVALWLGNESSTYEAMRDMSNDARDEYSLSKGIRAYVEDMQPDLGATLWSDLLGAAMSEVDWDEIASHYWADREVDEDDGEVSK